HAKGKDKEPIVQRKPFNLGAPSAKSRTFAQVVQDGPSEASHPNHDPSSPANGKKIQASDLIVRHIFRCSPSSHAATVSFRGLNMSPPAILECISKQIANIATLHFIDRDSSVEISFLDKVALEKAMKTGVIVQSIQ